MRTMRVAVAAVESHGGAHRGIRLAGVDGAPLPAFDPGAHIDVLLPGGLVRQYSLANAPSQRRYYEICVRRDGASRGGSAYLHDHLTLGETVEISLPRNHFRLDAAARYLLVAGGVGITPLLSMARDLDERGTPFILHCYGRSESDVPYLRTLREGFDHGEVVLHFSAAGDSLRGAVPAQFHTPSADALIYTCGPRGFMDQVDAAALEHGWQASQIRREAFDAAPSNVRHVNDAFEVELASSGRVFVIPPDQTIAAVLQAARIPVSLSCEQGLCGSCLTDIKAGQADHRDEVQSDEEKRSHRQIALCCSRAVTSRLVLDL
ncbi:PDR/VanB family oxidoreductase [Robbsia sp. Bb-Pol-6]|uniref:PDR/VanB family oxidoreductase n=1 Tax=Robbsia betulipollinis TaxID=2981849 RepID=A0ABT3ZJV9_9BURK|nr:PDR/VanB family oxidoreductase [Robbsia betulipollinis]MCY0386240.1 PDR/VanB family oxidoreductase [Robbsia betulipollinis]